MLPRTHHGAHIGVRGVEHYPEVWMIYGLVHRDYFRRLIENESRLEFPHHADAALLRDARGVAPNIRQTAESRAIVLVVDRSGRRNRVHANVRAADIRAHLDIT